MLSISFFKKFGLLIVIKRLLAFYTWFKPRRRLISATTLALIIGLALTSSLTGSKSADGLYPSTKQSIKASLTNSKTSATNNASSISNTSSPVKTPTSTTTQKNTQSVAAPTVTSTIKTVTTSASTPTTSSSSSSQSSTSNPNGFTTVITHNGQVAPGTLISYNPIKNYKVYYGGDLVFNQTNLYLYAGTANINNIFTVSIPDGQTSIVPHEPWNDVSSIAYPTIYEGLPNGIGFTGGSPTTGNGTSWIMLMALYGNEPIGTYTIHLTSIRTTSSDNGTADWEYDGFLTYTIYPAN